jgi:hypothetical protein
LDTISCLDRVVLQYPEVSSNPRHDALQQMS